MPGGQEDPLIHLSERMVHHAQQQTAEGLAGTPGSNTSSVVLACKPGRRSVGVRVSASRFVTSANEVHASARSRQTLL
jgi:hypothetical protein